MRNGEAELSEVAFGGCLGTDCRRYISCRHEERILVMIRYYRCQLDAISKYVKRVQLRNLLISMRLWVGSSIILVARTPQNASGAQRNMLDKVRR